MPHNTFASLRDSLPEHLLPFLDDLLIIARFAGDGLNSVQSGQSLRKIIQSAREDMNILDFEEDLEFIESSGKATPVSIIVSIIDKETAVGLLNLPSDLDYIWEKTCPECEDSSEFMYSRRGLFLQKVYNKVYLPAVSRIAGGFMNNLEGLCDYINNTNPV